MVFDGQADFDACSCRAQTAFHNLLRVVGQFRTGLKLRLLIVLDAVGKVFDGRALVFC